MNRKRWSIGICFITITLLYIWSNSLQSTFQSNEQSNKVLEIIEKVFNIPLLDMGEAQYVVRKVAHMLEFALLGFVVVLLLFITGKICRQNLVNALFFGLASAVMDETIQLFSHRGSQVVDIWIDFVGLVAGIGLGVSIFLFFREVRIHVHKRKQAAIYARHYGDK